MKGKNHLRLILLCLLSMCSMTVYAAAGDDIIEFQGDRYVIHVNRMSPDNETSLLDVLNTCQEFLSVNGKKIDLDYKLRVDNIDLTVDAKSFLANVKAYEITVYRLAATLLWQKPWAVQKASSTSITAKTSRETVSWH